MSLHEITPILLAGGSDTQLWPVSRAARPKQFCPVIGDQTPFQATVQRLTEAGCAAPIVMTHADDRFVVADQLARLGSLGHSIVLEPDRRGTAASVAVAVAAILADDPERLLLVAPVDHHITDSHGLTAALGAGVAAARAGEIVVYGAPPDRAEPGYGYLEIAPATDDTPGRKLKRYIDRPDPQTAAAFVEGGRHLWHTGLFLCSARRMNQALAEHAPSLVQAADAAYQAMTADLDFLRLGPAFQDAPRLSIARAVLAQGSARVLPLKAGWTDLGGWQALWQISPQDAAGVAQRGATRAIDCQDSLLVSDDPEIALVGVGLNNIAAIVTRDAVLVADLGSAEGLRVAVAAVTRAGWPQAGQHRRDERPWGILNPSLWPPGFRSNPSWFGPAGGCPCKAMFTALNIGSWSKARPASRSDGPKS